jgi:hypothetical protein
MCEVGVPITVRVKKSGYYGVRIVGPARRLDAREFTNRGVKTVGPNLIG